MSKITIFSTNNRFQYHKSPPRGSRNTWHVDIHKTKKWDKAYRVSHDATNLDNVTIHLIIEYFDCLRGKTLVKGEVLVRP
jgi:hypothetical protein